MINKIKNIIFSTRLMAVLFLVFGAAMACGTFIENSYGTDAAWILVYNTWWFEAIMVIFVINFLGNISKYNLTKRENWAVLLLHLSMILVIVGSGVTRYFGDEGRMSIREGESVNFYLSDQAYMTVFVDGEHEGEGLRKSNQQGVLFSEHVKNSYEWEDDFKGKEFEVEYKNFFKGVEVGFVADEKGENYIKIVQPRGMGDRQETMLKEGSSEMLSGMMVTLNKPMEGAINITINEKGAFIEPARDGTYMTMATQALTKVAKGQKNELAYLSLYDFGLLQFVIPNGMTRGRIGMIKSDKKDAMDMVQVEIKCGGEEKVLDVFGKKGIINEPARARVGGLDFSVHYGSVRYETPFSVKLNKFIADKYPGTENNYSAFKSKVSVMGKDGEAFDFDIYMNNILNYKGYRLFQASFHPDEKGTVLSVNHDFMGTLITYIGYGLLYLGLILMMFVGKSRFVQQSKKLREMQVKRGGLVSVLLLVSAFGFGQNYVMPTGAKLDSILLADKVKEEHAREFGKLIVQDDDGRMKPMNTFASELIRKISKRKAYKEMNADQVFLSMMMNPQLWYGVEFFYVKKDNDSLHKILGVEKGKKFLKVLDFYDASFKNKLEPYLAEAYATTNPNQFQKDFKDAENKLVLLDRTLSGGMFKIFPILGDANNKWTSALEYRDDPSVAKDSLYGNFMANAVPLYVHYLKKAVKTGDYKEADQMLEYLKMNQRKHGGAVMPTEKEIDAELLYNKYDVFENLAYFYMMAGVFMFGFLLMSIFFEKKRGRVVGVLVRICQWSIYLFFVVHTLGLAFRWYISGHAPWSDAYESMIYVGWATMAAGVFFSRRSLLAFASTAFVASMILMISHWNWLDPSIGTLKPVLNSYWLMIHVAVIVGSYGPFALGMILGGVNMVMMIMRSNKNHEKVNSIIRELTIVNELALTVGLVMLTIGNFLGGQWANESWGRYWGWDPKETWALISIMVYAFVIHMRLVPGLRGTWAFNFASVVSFASIMMTYFGVNFYLSGLHSYASGEKVITPSFVYYSVVIVGILGFLSYMADRKWKKVKEE